MKRPAQVDFVSRDSLPRGGGSGSSSLGVHGKGPARRSYQVVVHPDGATQRHETPSLMNASQRDFSCRGGQIIAFPPRPGLHQLGCLLDLGATIYC
ncbi:hypothetical protein BHM03_00008914 [Ensete ventricosum]|uniref:Uncharacterized protein n=1 Tax=Ensete ventricosum TaxID=4639 RepID=A0A445MCE6_ENSVE|nr:hypothetical protein BHM03_00008914 [Ensete ventricosum]